MEEKKSVAVQQSRITDPEKDLLLVFKDNEHLLTALRNLFFGFKLQDNERALLGQVQHPEVKKLMRKIFLPELGRDIPVGLSIDLWMTVKLGDPKLDKVTIQTRELLIESLETALALLDNLDGEVVSLKPGKSTESIMNRNTFVTHVELQLVAIRALANEKRETEEEKVLRMAQDSMK